MSRHPELYQWIDTVAMRFPSLSKPQALGLALWSFPCQTRPTGSMAPDARKLRDIIGYLYEGKR